MIMKLQACCSIDSIINVSEFALNIVKCVQF